MHDRYLDGNGTDELRRSTDVARSNLEATVKSGKIVLPVRFVKLRDGWKANDNAFDCNTSSIKEESYNVSSWS